MSEVILFSLFPDSIHFYVLLCGFVCNKDIDPDRGPANELSLITNGHGDPILEAKPQLERLPKSCWIRKM